MSILVLTSDTLIGTPATGNLEYNGQFYGTDSNASRAQMQRITQGTVNNGGANPLNNTLSSVDFTGIPSWVKRLTLVFNEISTNGASPLTVQIGDSTGFSSSGYIGISSVIAGANTTSPNIVTNGYYVRLLDSINTELLSGTMTINLITGTTWVSSHVCCQNIAGATPKTAHGAGTKTLTGTLDRVRITTNSGTPTFDAGSINILYEG